MSRLDRIVNAKFTVENAVPEGQDLGLILCIGLDAEFPQYHETDNPKGFTTDERTRYYSSVASMAEDGFLVTSSIYKLANTVFAQGKVNMILVGRKLTDDTNYTDALNTIVNTNKNWFGLLSTTTAEDDILDIASFAQENEKLYFAGTSDAGVISSTTTDDVASQLKALNYDYTCLSYHSDIANNRIDAVIVQLLGTSAGSTTLHLKTIKGVAVDVIGTNAEITLEDKNCNYYTEVAGLSSYTGGIVASGEFADVIRDKTWLIQQTQLRALQFLKTRSDMNSKIAFDNEGLESIELAVLMPLFQEALERQVIRSATKAEIATKLGVEEDAVEGYYEAFGFVLTRPNVANLSAEEKATREAKDFKFLGNIAGAIHSIGLIGNIFK